MTKLERELIAATMAWWMYEKRPSARYSPDRHYDLRLLIKDACAAYAKAQKKVRK